MPTTTTQKLIIAASLAGIGGGVWYFFIRKPPDTKKISGGGKTTPSGGKTTTSSGGGETIPATTTPSGGKLDIYGTDGKVHVASGKPVLGYDTWSGVPYYEPQPVEKVNDDLMKAVQYVWEWIAKKDPQYWDEEKMFFAQRAWTDKVYHKSPVAKADLELLDKLVKKAALEEAL